MKPRQSADQLGLFNDDEPAWQVLLYRPPLALDDRRWEYERVLSLAYDTETGVLAQTVTPDPRYL